MLAARMSPVLSALSILTFSSLASAQHETNHAQDQHQARMDIPSISHERMGSGTSWLPDETQVHAFHFSYDDWKLMLHGNLFLQYIEEGSRRGDDQFGSVNWLMLMGKRPVGGGELMLRSMLSAEPWTVGKCGYPDLLATGEICNGEPIHDRQHPHDLFMELAASYTHPLSSDLNFELYGGPVAEPALGPVAFPHRPSAFPGPLAPITHHWLDATHIAFGNITAGLFEKTWKVEASVFNGREPDENRSNIDLAPLDSYSGRLTFLPTRNWAFQVSAGKLNEAEASDEPNGPRADVDRYTTSAIYHTFLTKEDFWTNTIAYGRNVEEGQGTNAFLLESSLTLRAGHIFSGRAEWVEKTGHDLALASAASDDQIFPIAKIAAGYMKEFETQSNLRPGIGAGISVSFLPEDLNVEYGERNPLGFVIFLSLRPGSMPAPMKH